VPIPVTLAGGMADFDVYDRYWKQWGALGFSPQGHPMKFVRAALDAQGVGTCASLQEAKAGQKLTIGGLVLRPHRPPNAGGCVFFSLEDETALVQVTVLPDVYQRLGAAVYGSGVVVVTGRAERRGEGVSLLAEEVRSVS
jgi:error-prone DNA polymerase